MNIFVWLSLALSLLLLVLFPFAFSEVMIVGLAKLHLEPRIAMWVVISVFIGGLINIPVTRIKRKE
ncbi:hypothetical protein WOB59_24425 [Methylocystis sp. IM4]|uniref:hypothetical protein n=1 Tax=Methylocystis sp. IM4 TaxID=3136560 RepID=UPI00311A2EF0